MKKMRYFSSCDFMQQLFIIGGDNRSNLSKSNPKSCIKYTKGNSKYFEVSSLNEARCSAACVQQMSIDTNKFIYIF